MTTVYRKEGCKNYDVPCAYLGIDEQIVFVWYSGQGVSKTANDLTGGQVEFAMGVVGSTTNSLEIDSNAPSNSYITLGYDGANPVDLTNGRILVHIDSVDTDLLTAGNYDYIIKWTGPGGEVKELLKGVIKFQSSRI